MAQWLQQLRRRVRRVIPFLILVLALWTQCVYAQEGEAKHHGVSTNTSSAKNATAEHHGESGGEAEGGEEELTEAEVMYNVFASIVTITVLIFLSIVFEMSAEWLRESTDETNMPFVNTIFNELTTLGFIGSILFVMVRSGYLGNISKTLFGVSREMELQETIEMLHMALFLFVIIFLMLCIVLLNLGVQVQMELREFERRAPYVQVVVADYCLVTEPAQTWRDRYSLRRWLESGKRRREMVYVSLRRRFVDYHSNHPNPVLAKELAKDFQLQPDTRFPFNEYLAIISGEVMARLIQIDAITWVALEIVIVGLVLLCWAVGQDNEVFVILASGGILVFLNQLVYRRMHDMRVLLTPPLLFKKAERYRTKPAWRAQHSLPQLPSTPLVSDEKVPLLASEEKLATDSIPPYLLKLPAGGVNLNPQELAAAQKALLGGGNGVLLALFSTRLVFLFTALHFSVFIMRTSGQLLHRKDFHWLTKLGFLILLALPSCIVASVSIMIARDGLYNFNVEGMKVPRVITKVMRILKARQTLRTLRFIAEMKVYLREHHASEAERAQSTKALHQAIQVQDLANRASLEDKMPSFNSDSPVKRPSTIEILTSANAKGRPSKLELLSPSSRTLLEEPMSPISEPSTPKGQKRDKYDEEMERREINSIFCLFDKDGSGAITQEEMESLLHVISPDITEEQIERIMVVLDENKTGEVTFEEFYNWCKSHIHEQGSKHSKHHLIREVFKMIDTDGSGTITVDEFVAIFKALGQSLDHEDVRELVYQIDRNSDGKIDFEEFEKMLQKHAV
ncbi:Aste57867_18773 [Aphanomyces stellatus]|uniref:Aste57867_18773 protein n=1 Tax=Aphanomyces stellatus TaxID=120398 RepID=A0A485LBB1_9STRA|nr:hypothetical protein As57867_018709 [Aphanomyces stellatus]VFT95507.1 Aste57867_18773 [Aphanomyces stellatus]